MFLWWLIVCFVKHIHSWPSVCAVVSGSTGVLGSALVRKFTSLQWITHAGYRCEQNVQQRLLNNDNNHAIRSINLDRLSSNSLLSCMKSVNADHFVLVNNAACCLKGNAFESLTRSLNANVMLPVKLINEFLPLIANSNKTVTIVNISSGDGELVYLNSKLASELKLLSSMPALESWIINLIKEYSSSFEYAYGTTPMYSLTKAILNCLTRIVHDQHNHHPNFRIIACCPGNFISPMTSHDELQSIRSVEDVVKDITQIIEKKDDFPGGRFYRFGQQIDW